ncbi:other/FunK1 protein kinase [Coprinopsis cinerea okayama7|uniref:Other/FunK1 protein kinase n=1 Tax=Coprinopsis cinerea (strain Okayama-7 / 130 / ATCC MYA-4618 / FGSC 9003) TaxID=240176 RepID=A8PG25_COPC7|nr:other/FunK1 protein kinase [Coprinopsis cinerea okayama7\|eukprot:XP_001841127.2 other/FunK1 protein kinase [Coprinopsis cinerea okayama7\
MKSFQTAGNAVRRALHKLKGPAPNENVIRTLEVDEGSINGCLTNNCDGELRLTDVVVPFKVISTKPQAQNNAFDDGTLHPLIPIAIDVMNGDPRRRFMHGVTIKDCQVTLYYLSRSACAKSTPFDVTKYPEFLIRALVAMLTGTESHLGFDPLVTLLPDGGYVYEIPPEGPSMAPQFYQTVELLSMRHTRRLIGRMARIWRVRQITSPASLERVPNTSDFVLKDASLEADAPTEVEIQHLLFTDIVAFANDPNWRAHPILQDFRPEDLDSLGVALRDGDPLAFFSRIISSCVGEPELSSPGSITRRQCRYVYEQVCTPLHDIPTLGEAVDVLKQTLIALRIMFCAGWVHRDVSPGNILAYRAASTGDWRVKLSDLEFSKRFPGMDQSKPETKIGTPYFMACELLGEKPLTAYVPRSDCRSDSAPRRSLREPQPLIHNYQYDLESIFWILLWLVSVRVKENCVADSPHHPLIFQHRLDKEYAAVRTWVFVHELQDSDDVPQVPLHLRTFVMSHLEGLRQSLFGEYIVRHNSGSREDISTYSWILSPAFCTFFAGIDRLRAEWDSVELLVEEEHAEGKEERTERIVSKKRKRIGDGDGGGDEDEDAEVSEI